RLASSFDGGATFSRVTLSGATSRASAARSGGNDFGDYLGLAALDGTVRALWADNRGLSSDLEAFTAAASFGSGTGGNTLTVRGDETVLGASDTITLRLDPANAGLLQVLVNG